jgi:hypothetical protein
MRPCLSKRLYIDAELQSLLRLAPVPEIKKLRLASLPVIENALRALALQRGVAVRDYLAPRGYRPPESFWAPSKPCCLKANGHHALNLIWQCLKKSENTRIALIFKAVGMQALPAMTRIFLC